MGQDYFYCNNYSNGTLQVWMCFSLLHFIFIWISEWLVWVACLKLFSWFGLESHLSDLYLSSSSSHCVSPSGLSCVFYNELPSYIFLHKYFILFWKTNVETEEPKFKVQKYNIERICNEQISLLICINYISTTNWLKSLIFLTLALSEIAVFPFKM